MKEKAKKRGPREERLILSVDWKAAVGKALKKKRPASGWPKSEKKRKG